MNPALLFLMVRTVRGRIVRMARRLREPRYAVGFLVGAAWALFWLSRIFLAGDGDIDFEFGIPPERLEALADTGIQALLLVLSLVLAVVITLWWLVPLGGTSLEFSEPELHLLLPAPVSRRSLMQYAVLRSQPGVLFGSLMVTIFTGGFWPPLQGALRFLGVWVFFTIWDLHGKGRGLWLARQRELPRSTAWRRRLMLTGGLILYWAILATVLVGFLVPVLAGAGERVRGFEDVGDELIEWARGPLQAAWEGPIGWLLAPLVWMLKPYFLEYLEPGFFGWLLAWSFPLVALVAHNEWVVRSQARFEEAELGAAKRRSQKTAPGAKYWRLSERRRAWRPFRLAATGRPEIAIFWKNLLLVQRIPLQRLLGALLLAVIALVVGSRLLGVPGWFIGVLEIGSALLVLVPPFFTGRTLRNDLRNDLAQLEIIRTWPLAGWRLFLAEIAAPVALTLMQMGAGILLVVALDMSGLFGASGDGSARSGLAEWLAVPELLTIPLLVATWLPIGLGIALLTTSLENLAALAFPSWVHIGLDQKQAAAKFGQNLLVFFVLSLALLAGLAPGAVAVGLTLLAQRFVWGLPFSGWELPILGLIAAIPTYVVVGALIRAGGAIWDRLDPSQELLENAF